MGIIKRYKIITFFLLLAGFCILQNSKLHAQATTALKSYSSTEDIALAFYRTGNVIPNFDRWIREQAPYMHTPWAKRENVYGIEMLRLQTAYQTFDPKKDYLLVRTASLIKPQKIQNANGEDTYTINATFVEAPEALYFPYDFLNERIILMPYHLESVMNDVINKEQYEYIKKKIVKTNKVDMIIRMKPVDADFSKPHKIDGIEQWVFKTRVASIEFWNKKNELIWEYTAPWYTSPNILDIKNLYNDRPLDSLFKKGAVKPTYNKF